MTEEILVNTIIGENRVAAISNGVVQEVLIERGHRTTRVGNIYVGSVQRVLPGMQAAFVDIGLERSAFLHVHELLGAAPGTAQSDCESNTQASGDNETEPCITSLLAAGDRITVQVIKDAIGNKGARLSTHISIPSRLLVLLPGLDHAGVSLRIEDAGERERLRGLLVDMLAERVPERLPEKHRPVGLIARTNAEGASSGELAADLDYLLRLWRVIDERRRNAAVGTCIYEDLSLPLRVLRDRMYSEVDRVLVDDQAMLDCMREFISEFIDGWSAKLHLYQGERSIFDLFGVDDEIQLALQRDVRLKSGGYLSIDQTEAMTTIDVNTGAYVGYRNLEETIFRTNLEAAQAIARQLRLRNLGGIIIIDFIDMQDPGHRQQVLQTLERALRNDAARTMVYDFSPLGLVEMTRKRTTESLAQRLCEPCPVCGGRGSIKTADSVCYEIFREICRAVRQFDAPETIVIAAPEVVEKMLDDYTATVAEIEESIRKQIRFQPDDQYQQEQFDVVLK